MNPIARTLVTCAAAAALVGVGASASPASAARSTDPAVAWVSGSDGARGQTRIDDLAPPTRARTSPTTCRGVPATAIVDAGDDFVGSDADEVIVVLGSNAHVQADGGDDTICVHGNHIAPHEFSVVFAGDGDDVVLALSGALEAHGEDGEDVLLGNGTEMWFFGDDGSDDLNAGGATSALIDGGDWSDRITGSPGIDVLSGGQGEDGIWGWDGADQISGGTEDDTIHGGDGFDTLNGDDGWYDDCYDVDSPVDGAWIYSCTIHLTPDVADDLAFG